jgi:hypothetical protein
MGSPINSDYPGDLLILRQQRQFHNEPSKVSSRGKVFSFCQRTGILVVLPSRPPAEITVTKPGFYYVL